MENQSKQLLILVLIFAATVASFIFATRDSESFGQPPSLSIQPVAVAEYFEPPPVVRPVYNYVEVVEGCGAHYDGECVNVRSGPGTDHPSILKLRTGVVLKVAGTVVGEDRSWHKISFDEGLRYPERVTGDWYVAADVTRQFENEGDRVLADGEEVSSDKRIVVDLSEQKLYAYDGTVLFMDELVSTGLDLTPTPRGSFTVFRKMPSRYMQGPLPGISDQYYDLPGVPWNLYFTKEGGAIHGAYWHNRFGELWSHGCVNLPLEKARKLYEWADLGTQVVVRD